MASTDLGSNSARSVDSNFSEPDNPLRHYAGVLRRRARITVACVVGGLILGLISSFFIKQEPVKVHYYKAVNSLAMTGDGGTGSNGQGYTLDRAANIILDGKLLDTVGKKVGWDSVTTGHHLAATVRGEQYAIDVVGIATNPRKAEKLANIAAATLAKMADTEAASAYNSQLSSLTKLKDGLQKQVDSLQGEGQETQLAIAQRQLSEVNQQIQSVGTSPPRLGLVSARAAHAIEINKAGYKLRLQNAINLAGQVPQQQNAPVTTTDQVASETDLSRPTVPGRIQLIVIGGVLGLIIGIIVSFMVEAWDDKVRSRERVESLCDLPVLAEIPNLDSDEAATHAVAMVDSPKSPVAERYRATCTAALFALGESATERPATGAGGERPHAPVILVTSPSPGEGKTTTSANIAAAFADTGRRVLAVDADFRRPALAKFLVPVANLNDPEAPSETRIPNVSFLAAPHHMAAVGDTVFELRKLIAAHLNGYDVIVVDTPPMLTTNDAIDLLAAADATLLVLRAGRTRTNSAQRAATVLSRLRADVLGVVLNGCDRKEMENYYGYGYGYGEGYYYYHDDANPKKQGSKKSKKRTKRSEPRSPNARPSSKTDPNAFVFEDDVPVGPS